MEGKNEKKRKAEKLVDVMRGNVNRGRRGEMDTARARTELD